jgi:hypothetical protein
MDCWRSRPEMEPFMSGKQKVLLAVTLTALLLCSSGALYGYFELWPRLRSHTSNTLENEIAATIERSVDRALASETPEDGTVRITAADLDFSSVHDASGESGFDVVNDDATIYNAYVEILPDGIHFYLADMQLDGTPAIIDGQFVLSDTTLNRGITGKMLDTHVLEQGVTRGVNAAFVNASLQPIGLYILDNKLHVSVEELETPTMT